MLKTQDDKLKRLVMGWVFSTHYLLDKGSSDRQCAEWFDGFISGEVETDNGTYQVFRRFELQNVADTLVFLYDFAREVAQTLQGN